MTSGRVERASIFRSMQVLLFVFSLIFFSIISYGYFYLFIGMGYFLGVVCAIMMALFAWFLARVIGTSQTGVRGHPLLFAALLAVSAAGVYNSLMLYLEGNSILADAITESQTRFARLEGAAERGLQTIGATPRQNRVRALSESLFSEIRNPLNCGQGPVAQQLISDLQRELPGFTPLSNQGLDCSRNEQVISDYRQRINDLMARADWNSPGLTSVIAESNAAQRTLEELRSSVAANYAPNLLRQTLSTLETHDSLYRNLLRRASRQADIRDLERGLHLSEVQSLGNAFKLPALFLERLDQPATWVYLAMAVVFDLLMIKLFQLVSANRVRPAPADHLSGGL